MLLISRDFNGHIDFYGKGKNLLSFVLPLSVMSQFLKGGRHLSIGVEEMHIVDLHPPASTDHRIMSIPRHRTKPEKLRYNIFKYWFILPF